MWRGDLLCVEMHRGTRIEGEEIISGTMLCERGLEHGRLYISSWRLTQSWCWACNTQHISSFSRRRQPPASTRPVGSASLGIKLLKRLVDFWEHCQRYRGVYDFPSKPIRQRCQHPDTSLAAAIAWQSRSDARQPNNLCATFFPTVTRHQLPDKVWQRESRTCFTAGNSRVESSGE